MSFGMNWSGYDWNSDENLVLMNPRLPEADAKILRALLDGESTRALRGHVFLLTSGTTALSAAGFKWVALSKAAILKASASSNKHLESDSRDIWLHCLPEFHVGGMSIWARSSLSGARVVKSQCTGMWDAAAFAREAHETSATLCSLVPTQVHDLIKDGHRAPASLRAILLGGGAASKDLVDRARDLGWRVLPTYGMTETASQVATAPLHGSGESLEILSHLEVSTGADQRLRVRGESVLSGYIIADSSGQGVFVDPKIDGWFVTDDFGEVSGRSLQILGRMSDRIKIGGELVHFGRLTALLEEEATRLQIASQVTLFVARDERLESVIHVVRENACDLERVRNVVDGYNRRVLPFERIRSVQSVPTIPRTDLGKIKRAELGALLSARAP